jgi:hypothetical protein
MHADNIVFGTYKNGHLCEQIVSVLIGCVVNYNVHVHVNITSIQALI